ncbi:MAG TPA: ABC transporter ATP-binding protein [Phycisphaerae bacterium]|nr:ABC transporter ATP-binding protein [Phycisphaerae bacterium]
MVEMPGDSLLEVRQLRVAYGDAFAVAGVDLDLHAGKVTALVGPSGSGKSTVALAIMGLLPTGGRIVAGTVRLTGASAGRDDVELVAAGERTVRNVRGRHIAMIFQSPGTALNPVMTVGAQIREALRLTGMAHRSDRAKAVARLLEEVELPPRVARDYPHQLSGGMQQRVMIAMALAGGPQVLLADEPTSALDVTVQAQILALLGRLQRTRGMAVLLITHDIAVAAQVADTIVVLDAGAVVEHGPTSDVLTAPQSPTAQRLVSAARTLAEGPQAVRS